MESASEPPSKDLHTHMCCSSQFSNSLAVPLASQHPPSLGKTLSYGHIVCSGIPASFLHLSQQCLRACPSHTWVTFTLAKQATLAHPHLGSTPKRSNMHIHISISILILKVENAYSLLCRRNIVDHDATLDSSPRVQPYSHGMWEGSRNILQSTALVDIYCTVRRNSTERTYEQI